jgi:short/branched chain acyl-CoA dehydrogenase
MLRTLTTPSRIRPYFSRFLHMPPVVGASSLTDEEKSIRDAASIFASEHLTPARVLKMDKEAKIEPTLIRSLFDSGFMGIEIAEKHGGAGASFVASCLAIEEFAKKDASVAVMVDVQNTLVNNVFKRWGSPEIQDFAYPLLAQKEVGAFCLSEPGSGSDAFALKTRAEKDGKHWVINGGKVWITNGGEAGLFLIFANVDPSKGYRGITAFLAEKNAPGLSIGKFEDKLGIRASSTAQLHFDGLRVHESRIVGKIGEGYKIAIGILNEGRVGIAAQMLGIAQGAMDIAVPYTLQRKQFGTRIADFQGIQHQIAQAAADIAACRALVYNAARMKMAIDEDHSIDPKDFIVQAAMAKLIASQVAERTAGKAIEWMGGMGFVKESGVEKFWRDAKIGAIYEGECLS